jgi:hypothetical protein
VEDLAKQEKSENKILEDMKFAQRDKTLLLKQEKAKLERFLF